MRTVLGPAATALERRGLALERGAMVTLRQDASATPPGPTLGLAIGERTTYRPGVWLLDTFERDALGDTYAAWGGAAGLTLGAGGVTAAVGPVGMVTHPRALPRDSWAALTIGALSGDAEVGLLLRAADTTADGYWITATPTLTVVERLDAGVVTSLASVATPWRVGAMLRAVWAWDQLRVYRDTILVAQVTDGGRLLAGRAGFTARRGDTGAAAIITAVLGGEARQEWLGAGLDLGDVQRALGQPATFELTLSNVAPMGGADRFAALLRHGLNTEGTYDLDRGAVRVLTVVDGLSPPLTAGVGVIDGVSELTEDRVRLACRGRDAFLTPQLAAGPVTYLAGPPPGGLTPLPPEPCAPSTPPEIVPGDPPAEPVDPPVTEGVGPEAPPADGGGGGGPLLGFWTIRMGYRPGVDAEPAYVLLATEVTAGPLWYDEPWTSSGGSVGSPTYTPSRAPFNLTPFERVVRGAAVSESLPDARELLWLYRGPDVVGGDFLPLDPGWFERQVRVTWTVPAAVTVPNVTVHLAHYGAGSIRTVADLAALHPALPDLSEPSTLPVRIDTLAAYTAAGVTFSGAGSGTGGVSYSTTPSVDQFAGPQLLGIEIQPGWSVGGHPTVEVLAGEFVALGPFNRAHHVVGAE